MSHVRREPVYNEGDNQYEYVPLKEYPISTDDEQSHWPGATATEATSGPRPLAQRWLLFSSLTLDLLCIAVPGALIGFAIYCCSTRDSILGEQERKLLDAARTIGTAFPFVAIFVVGRALQTLFQWPLEESVVGLNFVYPSRGFTPGNAHSTAQRDSEVHWISAISLLLWVLSSLGSQASLRFIYDEYGTVTEASSRRLYYIYPMAVWGGDCIEYTREAHDAVFLAPLLSQSANRHMSQDTWGNIKIPLVADSEAANGTAGSDGWVNLSMQDEREYSSLVGIPSSKLTEKGNMTFTMDSWYWEAHDARLWASDTTAPLLQAAREFNGSELLTNYTATGLLWQFALPLNWDSNNGTDTIPMTFEAGPFGYALNNSLDATYEYGGGKTKHAAFRLEFGLRHRPVELNVTCAAAMCQVTAIRNSSLPNGYETRFDMTDLKECHLPHLTHAFPPEVYMGIPGSGALEAYLSAPSVFPYSVLDRADFDVDLSHLSARTVSQRLAQVLNAYWIVENVFEHAAGGFNASAENLVRRRPGLLRNSTVTTIQDAHFFKADGFWFGTLCVCSLMMMLTSLVSAVLLFMRLAPDLLGCLLTLKLHEKGHALPRRSSYMSIDKKVRLRKDVRCSIRDVRADEPVGQVDIAREGEVGPLKRGRLCLSPPEQA